MSDNTYLYIISPIITALIGGVGYLVKKYIDSLEIKRDREIAERDKRRAEIEDRVSQTEMRLGRAEKSLKRVVKVVMECKHSDCPTKDKILDIWEEDYKTDE